MPRRSARSSIWPLVAVGLWVPTVAVGGLLWLQGPSAEPRVVIPDDDARQGIVVTLDERELTMRVMRENLDNLHGILAAMAEDDRPQLAELSRKAAEMHGPARRSASLRDKLPDGWRAMGKQVDIGFERLAQAAATPDADLMGPLTEATAACVACHQTYRLDLQL